MACRRGRAARPARGPAVRPHDARGSDERGWSDIGTRRRPVADSGSLADHDRRADGHARHRCARDRTVRCASPGRPGPLVVHRRRPDRRTGRRGQPGRPAQGGLRFPAVLGGLRQRHAARLGEALDGGLLRGRGDGYRRVAQDQHRWLDECRLEWLDELEADLDHQRRARPPHTGRPDRAELRVDRRAARHPEGIARVRQRTARARAPDRGGRARSRCRRREPGLRTHRVRVRG